MVTLAEDVCRPVNWKGRELSLVDVQTSDAFVSTYRVIDLVSALRIELQCLQRGRNSGYCAQLDRLVRMSSIIDELAILATVDRDRLITGT